MASNEVDNTYFDEEDECASIDLTGLEDEDEDEDEGGSATSQLSGPSSSFSSSSFSSSSSSSVTVPKTASRPKKKIRPPALTSRLHSQTFSKTP
jgi:hypothetical protein